MSRKRKPYLPPENSPVPAEVHMQVMRDAAKFWTDKQFKDFYGFGKVHVGIMDAHDAFIRNGGTEEQYREMVDKRYKEMVAAEEKEGA